MSYIGADYTQQLTTPAIDYFSGNGVTTTFTLTRSVTSVFSVEVVVNGVLQNPATAYTINTAGNLVFDGAPSAGTNNIYVKYNSQVGQFVTPSPGTVGTSSLANITNIRSGTSNLTLQTGGNNTTALTIDQNQIIKIQNTATVNTSLQLGRVHIALTDAVRNTTLMNANNTNTLAVLSAPFASPELTANAGARWGMLFNGNGDFNTTPAGLATANKSAGVFAVSEDGAAGYNRQVGIALHTCGFDQGHREAMRISGTGLLTVPNQPAFSAAGTSGTYAAGSRIDFGGKIITSNRAVNYNATNSRFTAPVAGVYFFGFAVWLFSTAGYKQLVFRRNGGDYIPSDTYLAMAHDVYTDDSVTVTLGMVIELAVNDFIEVGVRNATNAANIYGGHSYFYGYLIG